MGYDLLQLISSERITEISKERGFRPDIMEHFLMDYLVHQRVTEGIRCVTKGGMCMPFYQSGGTLQRLSVDVDLATKLPPASVDSAAKLAADLSNVTGVRMRDPPPKAAPKNNLVTYDVRYKSCVGPMSSVKVDFLYGLDVDYETRTVPAGEEIIGFKIPHEMEILTRSALMADKIGTLAMGTIGVEERRVGEVAKQVFDVGTLLGGATADDISGFFAEFANMLAAEKSIHGKPELGARAVVDSIGAALGRMQDMAGDIRFTGAAKKNYEDFRSAYISREVPYHRNDHHANILSLRVLNRLMGQVLDGRDGKAAAADMAKILADAGDVSDYQHVRELYGTPVREATGMREKHLERMDARLSCLLCAHAALATG